MDLSKGLKNFIDNAKRKINEKGESPQRMGSKNFQFDENFIDFQLEGGPKHSELLVASCKFKEGPNAGDPIPTTCKWFVADHTEELKEVKGLAGAFYQPSVDDVGCRMIVQATPEGPYIGSALIAEVGPLVLDEDIERHAMSNLEGSSCELNTKIEAIYFDYDMKSVGVPSPGILYLDKETKKLTVFVNNREGQKEILSTCNFNDSYPSVEIIKKSNTIFELHLGPANFIKCSALNTTDRDIITITLRMFGRMAPSSKDSENKNSQGSEAQYLEETVDKVPSLEAVMKMQALTSETRKLNRENSLYKESLESEKEKIRQKEEEINSLKNKLKDSRKMYDLLMEEMDDVKTENEKFKTEIIFYLQEFKMFQAKAEDLEKELQSYKNSDSLSNFIDDEKDKIRTEVDDKLKELNTKVLNLQNENDQLRSEHAKIKSEFEGMQTEKEELSSQVNSLRNKVKSLQIENDKLLGSSRIVLPVEINANDKFKSPNIASPQSLSRRSSYIEGESPSVFRSSISIDDITPDKERLFNLEEEVKTLREQNKRLNMTVDTLKNAIDAEKKNKQKNGLFGVFGTASSKPIDPQSIEYLQKLVGTLTETIGEKEIALEDQKKINKGLAKRINELELALKSAGSKP